MRSVGEKVTLKKFSTYNPADFVIHTNPINGAKGIIKEVFLPQTEANMLLVPVYLVEIENSKNVVIVQEENIDNAD